MVTPDRLVICLEELIREMASSDSGKIRAGIDVGLWCQADVQIGQYTLRYRFTAVTSVYRDGWLVP